MQQQQLPSLAFVTGHPRQGSRASYSPGFFSAFSKACTVLENDLFLENPGNCGWRSLRVLEYNKCKCFGVKSMGWATSVVILTNMYLVNVTDGNFSEKCQIFLCSCQDASSAVCVSIVWLARNMITIYHSPWCGKSETEVQKSWNFVAVWYLLFRWYGK